MKKLFPLVAILIALAIPAFADDATITTPTDDPVVSLKIAAVEIYYVPEYRSVVTLVGVRQSGVIAQEEVWVAHITNGPEESKKFVNGNGQDPQANGILNALIRADTAETGKVEERANRAVLRWLNGNKPNVMLNRPLPDLTIN